MSRAYTAVCLTSIAFITAVPVAASAQDLSRTAPHGLFAPANLVGTQSAPALSLAQVPGVTKTDDQHPPPQHTGFGAFVRTMGGDFVAFPKRRSTWVILGIGGGAALIAHPVDHDVNSHLAGSVAAKRFFAAGKVIGSAEVQVGVAAGLYLIGRYLIPAVEGQPRTNKYSHLGYDLLRAQILSQVIVQGIKVAVRRDRPTGECCSFPSGHAATAFAVASVLERHLGYRLAWPTVVAATYVATSRLHDNRHYLSDVLFGSAVGMATGWTIVGRHGRNQYALVPLPAHGGFGVALTRLPKA